MAGSETSPAGTGNLTFSLGMGIDRGGREQKLSNARPKLSVRESGFCEDSPASSIW